MPGTPSAAKHQGLQRHKQRPQGQQASPLREVVEGGKCQISNITRVGETKVMFKILQARLQWYMNRETPDVQAGFRKGRGARDQIAKIHWIIEKAREFQKNIYFCFIDYARAFDCVDHNKLWKILQEMGIPQHLTCLLRNLYAGQEATVRTRYRKQTGFKLEKEYVKAVYCHPAYLTICRVHHEKCWAG